MHSANFEHLKEHSIQLFRLGFLAERFFTDDPNTSLIKSRQFAELLTKEIAARTGNYRTAFENFNDLLRHLKSERIVPNEVSNLLHAVRVKGNSAVHEFVGTHEDALTCLKFSRALGIWFHQTFGNVPNFKLGPFVPPPDPRIESAALAEKLEALRREVLLAETRARSAEVSADEQLNARRAAEEMARQEKEDREVWEKIAEEQEAAQLRLEEELSRLQSKAESEPQRTHRNYINAGFAIGLSIDIDEADTRDLIDLQLSEKGWEANSSVLRHANGTRPERGRNLAIAEWPTATGPADYALLLGLTCVGIIEAKRASYDVPSTLEQAKRYARLITLAPENLDIDAPWQHGLEPGYRAPFIFASNGRPYVRQFETKSGVWYWDGRKETNHPVALPEWFSPDDLKGKLQQNISAAATGLAEEPFDYAGLRPYQQQAIASVETAIEAGQREILISMATGTGKTRTCIALMYRLLKHRRFRRILFLVDRKALGDQTTDALDTTELEGFLKFSQIYKVAGLNQKLPGPDDQVHVATVQSLVARILNEDDPTKRPTPGMYDCIIVDEAHRGYTLDAELRESDVTFRNIDDYLSKYRQVLEYFDAVKVGLTATPALHTREIFGHPVFNYSYRRAVIDGYLIDHLPPKRITTALSQAGIRFEGGEEVEIIDPRSGQIDLFEVPDVIEFEVEQFNKRVYSEAFNRVVCEALAAEIDINEPGKTLIFAARDDHADTVVRLLKEALESEHGPIHDSMVMKITGAVDRVAEKILRFRNDPFPKFVVTVDLLTTGVDIPKICNLVFLRRVNSRILYDQMIGRATRQCRDIGKQSFRIFDAVDLYAHLQELSDMRPVVARPNTSLAQLLDDLRNAPTKEDKEWVVGQIVVRLRTLARNAGPAQREALGRHTGVAPDGLADALNGLEIAEVEHWFDRHPRVVEILDQKSTGQQRDTGIFISTHDDELHAVEDYFGENATPEDYIEGFERFVKSNMNTVPALIAVTQRPRDLTRRELRELATLLDDNGFSEAHLRAAYGRVRNADIAAHIIGYVRQAALGDPLVPYETRVENALRRIEAAHPWTSKQKQWLRRIGRALKETPVADAEALDQGAFASQGGFRQISKEFDGRLEEVLHELNAAIWTSPAA
ncbi:type I restriction-modification system endonuclease [Sinorhizobium meliloti]|uniref:type I restriction-modification system endonuclease n=1 Tax=Rhizobium meliloti TaxID=382 RepID=UPI00398CBC03